MLPDTEEEYYKLFENDYVFVRDVEKRINSANVHYTSTMLHSIYLFDGLNPFGVYSYALRKGLAPTQEELRGRLIQSYRAKNYLSAFLINNKARYSFEWVFKNITDDQLWECKYDFSKCREITNINSILLGE